MAALMAEKGILLKMNELEKRDRLYLVILIFI